MTAGSSCPQRVIVAASTNACCGLYLQNPFRASALFLVLKILCRLFRAFLSPRDRLQFTMMFIEMGEKAFATLCFR